MNNKISVSMNVNGKEFQAPVDSNRSLLDYLRNDLGLKGPKNGCSTGHCGACSVILNGKITRSCLVKMKSPRLENAIIETIEGLAKNGSLHVLQASFIEHGAIQCGFCTPGMLMTSKALLDQNPAPTGDEFKEMFTRNNNLCRCTGYTKIIEAVQGAAERLAAGEEYIDPAEAMLDETADRSALVQDALGHVRGATKYSDDLQEDRMLFGKIVKSTHPHAEILNIDTSDAERLDGVALVLTAKDIPGENISGFAMDQPAIAADKVRFVGDPLAVVFAETSQIANEGAKLVNITYRPLPGVFSWQEAAQPNAPAVHEGGNLRHRVSIARGDVGEAFSHCEVVVRRSFNLPRIEHAFLEPEAGIGIPDLDGGVTIKIGTQCAHDDQGYLERILNLPKDKVRVIQMPTGGAFGGKLDFLIHQFLGLGAVKSGRPVKITLTREESLRTHVKQHPVDINIKLGADKEGMIQALEAEFNSDAGAYASFTDAVLNTMVLFAGGPYFIPNAKVEGKGWYTNTVPSGSFRGFGTNQAAVAIETLIDEVSKKLDLDPFAIREKNIIKDGLPMLSDQLINDDTNGLPDTIDAARSALAQLQLPRPTSGKKIGIGIASAIKNVGYGLGAIENAGAAVELKPSGRLTVKAAQSELGQGARSGIVHQVAEEMDIPMSMIDVVGPDTQETPHVGHCAGSRTTFLVGNAVIQACRDLKSEIFARAAEEIDIDPGLLRIAGDSIVADSANRKMKIADIGGNLMVERHYNAPKTIPLSNGPSRFGMEDFESHMTFWSYAYCTHVAVIEVDEKSGQVRVLKHIAVHDVGKVISRGALEGQIAGGVMQGIGYALSEEFIVENGEVVTNTLKKCGIPLANMAPEVIPILIEISDPEGPEGAKGVGELPAIPATPAVLNAIYDAVGVRMTTLPAKPERVLQAMNEERGLGVGVQATK
jgi:aldehyde oxidoreductase